MTDSDELRLISADFNPFKDDITGTVLLGRYRVVRRLAAGGMGVVYLARAEGAAGFAKPVVIKLILPNFASDEHFAGMFIREAKILASLQHPGIVDVIDFARDSDCYVMVLEYVNGYQLGQWKRYRDSKNLEIPAAVIIKIMLDVLDALHYAHCLRLSDGTPLNIIHRDISPSNILIDTGGRVKVVDFGIAVMEENSGVYKTQNESSFKGKLAYAAPELFANSSASVQSDTYACGVVLHEILLGYNDFKGPGYGPTLGRVLTHEPTLLSPLRKDLTSQIDVVMRKALHKDPSKRYQTAQEFSEDLRKVNLLDENVSAELLQRMILEDFSEEMADFLGVESLDSRDRAWRNPSMLPEARESYTRQLKPVAQKQMPAGQSAWPEEPSEEDGRNLPRERDREKSFPKVVLFGLSILAIVAAAVGITIGLTGKAPQADQKILIVQSPFVDSGAVSEPGSGSEKPSAGQGETPDKAASDASPKPVVADGEPSRGENRLKKNVGRAQSDVARLTRAFKKEKDKIRRCFEIHAFELEGTPEVSFRFEISADGSVQKVQLSPSGLAATTLGKCLKAVAVATEFPKLGKSASLNIPVRVMRGPK